MCGENGAGKEEVAVSVEGNKEEDEHERNIFGERCTGRKI